MPLPLFWLGAAAVSALAVKELADDRKKQQRDRSNYGRTRQLTDLDDHDAPVQTYPTFLRRIYEIGSASFLACRLVLNFVSDFDLEDKLIKWLKEQASKTASRPNYRNSTCPQWTV